MELVHNEVEQYSYEEVPSPVVEPVSQPRALQPGLPLAGYWFLLLRVKEISCLVNRGQTSLMPPPQDFV